MRKVLLTLAVAALVAAAYAAQRNAAGQDGRSDRAATANREQVQPDRIRGRTIRWTWTEGPVAGTTHEHVFHEDGAVTWRVVTGPQQGHSAREREYAAERITDDVYVVSYLAASGHTLTVVLDFGDGTMVGFASGEGRWFPGRGTFEVVA